ncbi:hypothetical protein TIFTF001_004393 [Ficus carica]|uniref:Uncharacterized protein n=1 Tax=Ficus carica TaxID=3494 RepID=A0AA87ZBI2_FICCA|nr:hypothetical protein TIFTF001_004393 [Ficus carica]
MRNVAAVGGDSSLTAYCPISGLHLPAKLNLNQTLQFMGGLGVLWDANVTSELEGRTEVWYAEIEVKKMEVLEIPGEVLWSEMVHSCGMENLYGCMQAPFPAHARHPNLMGLNSSIKAPHALISTSVAE